MLGGTCKPTLSRRRLIAGAGSAAALSACGKADGRVFTSSDTHPEGYPTVEAVKEMARSLHARTNGRLDIHVYAGGQLGAERDALEITIFGGLDLCRVNLAPLSAIEPLTVIPSLPFMFRSTEHMRRALDGAPGEAILASLESHEMIGLCFYDSGERNFYTTRGPITKPEDMKGLKIRVPNSDLYVSTIRALGGDATPMDLGEAYQALVQRVIDGAENNWPSYESGRHFEAAPYYSLTRHMMTPEVLVMSRSRWKTLSEQDQALVRSAAKESVGYMRTLWDQRVEDARARLLAAGVKVHEVENPEAFAALARPVWDRFLTTPEQRSIAREIEDMAES